MPISIKIIVCLKIVVKIKEDPQKMLNIKTEVENQRNSPKKKVTLIGDSIIKCLRRENLSSKNYEVKI